MKVEFLHLVCLSHHYHLIIMTSLTLPLSWCYLCCIASKRCLACSRVLVKLCVFLGWELNVRPQRRFRSDRFDSSGPPQKNDTDDTVCVVHTYVLFMGSNPGGSGLVVFQENVIPGVKRISFGRLKLR